MFLPSSYVEAVTPSVTVLGKRTYKEGIKVKGAVRVEAL
jgi:hypothetical protein